MKKKTKKSNSKSTGNYSVINLAQYEAPIVSENIKDDYVSLGKNNDYYDWLIDRTRKSTTNGSIIHNITRLIYGKGIAATDANRKPSDWAMLMGMVSPKVLKSVAHNLKALGAGYFQVHYNKKHTRIVKAEYIQTRLIRAGKCDDKGIIDTYYYSDDWKDLIRNKEVGYPAYGTSNKRIEIYCVKFESLDMKYYSDVDYISALPYAILEEEIADYLINETQNSFSGTKLINFNNGIPKTEQRAQIEGQVRSRVSGSRGDKTVIAFNENKDHATTIEDISLNDAPEHYGYLSKEAQSKLLNAHGVISPMIVGIVTESQGFSSSADEIEVATKVFYNQTIVPFQEPIIEALTEFLAFNNATLDLYFKRSNMMDSIEEKLQEKEAAELKMSSDFSKVIARFGEDEIHTEWDLIDSRDVDYELEVDLNNQVDSWEIDMNEKPTLLSRILSNVVSLVSTGRANTNRKSIQDRKVNGFYFKVRYKYVGNPSPERGFCKAMMSQNKIYRKEDIDMMSNGMVNAGFGQDGSDNYDIFKFKGGARCSHKWQRLTFVSSSKKQNMQNPNATKVSTGKARKFGYNPLNKKEVSMKPRDMDHKGFHPSNNNLPKDAR